MAVLIAINDTLDDLLRYRFANFYIVLGMAFWIEIAVLALAFLVFAWGGLTDERLGESYRHSLRQVWIRTPHGLLIIVLVCFSSILMKNAGNQWRRSHPEPPSANWPTYPVPPSIPVSDPGYAAAQKQYKKDMQDFQKKAAVAGVDWQKWRAAQPWYLRNDQPIIVALGLVGTGWWLVALLVAVGIKRDVASIERSPHCLKCGYDLSHMAMESRCPECGQPLAHSLGPDAQPGAPWESRATLGAMRAWLRTWRLLGRDVDSFGRALQLRSHCTNYRSYFACHLPIVLLIGMFGMIFGIGQGEGIGRLSEDIPGTLLIGGLFGSLCVIGTTVVTCASASLVGWFLSLRARRNVLPASMQTSAYGVVYLTAWAILGGVLINGAFHMYMSGLYRIAEDLTGIHHDALFFFSCLIPNAVCGLTYLWLVAKGTNAARFANK